jgi:hypothetical protein
MQHELLDSFETEDGEIGFSFYQEAGTEGNEHVYVWLRVGQAGVKIPSNIINDFHEVAEAIRIYLEDLEYGPEEEEDG